MDLSKLRILLIQIRQEPDALQAELEGFVNFSGLQADQFTSLDVFREPDFNPGILDRFDGFMIGGLSDDPSDSTEIPLSFLPWIHHLFDLMQYGISQRKPALLSCGGFMLASQMLGAPVVIDADQQEMGVYDIYLTEEARKDLLFQTCPASFKAVSGHLKTTDALPDGCLHLAYSERCRIHGFKVKNAPFYAFQFHPEIHCAALRARVEPYRDKYFPDEAAYRHFLDLMADTTIANLIVEQFIFRVVAQR